MHFSGGQRFYFFREITYAPGVVRKHPKTTFQLFQRLRYWEFYKRTKTLRIGAYGSLRYAVPKNVSFSNGNNRFRVIESEVDFRRGVKKLLKIAIMISFVDTTDGNIVEVCIRLLQVVISDNAIDNSLETRDTIGDTEE